jgi:ribosome assembly protein YihI (activator of Der GTPase)
MVRSHLDGSFLTKSSRFSSRKRRSKGKATGKVNASGGQAAASRTRGLQITRSDPTLETKQKVTLAHQAHLAPRNKNIAAIIQTLVPTKITLMVEAK